MNWIKLISPIEPHELTLNQKLARVEWCKNIKILIGIVLYLQMKVHSDEEKEKRRYGKKNIANIRKYGKKINVGEVYEKEAKYH